MSWKCKLCDIDQDANDPDVYADIHDIWGSHKEGGICYPCWAHVRKSYCPYVDDNGQCLVIGFHLKRPAKPLLVNLTGLLNDLCGIIVDYYASEYEHMVINKVCPEIINEVVFKLRRSTEAAWSDWISHKPENLDFYLDWSKGLTNANFYEELQHHLSDLGEDRWFALPLLDPFKNKSNLEQNIESSMKAIEAKQSRKRKKWEAFLNKSNDKLQAKRRQLEQLTEEFLDDNSFYTW